MSAVAPPAVRCSALQLALSRSSARLLRRRFGTSWRLIPLHRWERATISIRHRSNHYDEIGTLTSTAVALFLGAAAADAQLQKDEKSATNLNVSINVGTRVPRSVRLEVLPVTVIQIVPEYRSYRYFVVDDQICIVEPSSYEIVEVIRVSDRTAARDMGGGSARLVLTEDEIARLISGAKAPWGLVCWWKAPMYRVM